MQKVSFIKTQMNQFTKIWHLEYIFLNFQLSLVPIRIGWAKLYHSNHWKPNFWLAPWKILIPIDYGWDGSTLLKKHGLHFGIFCKLKSQLESVVWRFASPYAVTFSTLLADASRTNYVTVANPTRDREHRLHRQVSTKAPPFWFVTLKQASFDVKSNFLPYNENFFTGL